MAVLMLPLLLLSQFVNVKEESANTQTEKWFRKYILSLILEKISIFPWQISYIFARKATNFIFRCVPGVCSNFNPGTSFDAGFSHPDADAANFNPNLVSCTNLMPASHPDPQIAGKPALGSKCSIEW